MLTNQPSRADGLEAECRQGLIHAAAGRHQDAASCYLAAWALLPEPREARSEAPWILSAIVGAALAKGCSDQALALRRTVREARGAANPALRVALAEVCLAMGLRHRASEELAAAVASGGPAVLRQGGAACRALLLEGTPP